jgi:voltage-gated potassium channel
VAIAALVLLSSGIFVAQTYDLPEVGALLVESTRHSDPSDLCDRICAAAVERRKRVAYFFNIYALIDLLAILPFFLGAVGFGFCD